MDPALFASTGSASPLMRDLVVILAAAAGVALALQRLRFATIPAYLITGALIGPGALAFVSSAQNVQAISDLATVLLLFGVGLHIDLSILTRGLKRMFAGTVLSTALCSLALWPLCLLVARGAAGALVVAMALSISSTVVVLRVLMQRRVLTHPEGRLSFGVLILQDLVAVVLLMLLPPLARWSGTGTAGVALHEASSGRADLILRLVAGGLLAVGGIGLIVGFGRYVLPRLLTEAARAKSSEVLIVLTTAAALLASALTQRLLDNAAIGAFLAGFLLSSTPFRHQISGQVGAIRDVFSAVFFTSIGMSVSLVVLWEHLPLIVAGTAAMMVIKGALIGVSLWLTGATGNVALKSGLALSQSGEFSVLMLASAAAPAVALIDSDAVGKAIAITVFSLILTPTAVAASASWSARLPRIAPPAWFRAANSPRAARAAVPGATPHPSDTAPAPLPADRPLHAIIAGFGLVGRAVADELRKLGATVTVVDLNPETIRRQTALGRGVIFGDVSNLEVLEQAGVDRADLLILTIPDEESVLRACRLARRVNPSIFILARANYVSQGVVAAGMGADGVIVEEMATALEMERMLKKVLAARGMPVPPGG